MNENKQFICPYAVHTDRGWWCSYDGKACIDPNSKKCYKSKDPRKSFMIEIFESGAPNIYNWETGDNCDFGELHLLRNAINMVILRLQKEHAIRVLHRRKK